MSTANEIDKADVTDAVADAEERRPEARPKFSRAS